MFNAPELRVRAKKATRLDSYFKRDGFKAILAGLSYDVYVAQSSLPKEQRIAKYQAAIDANNALAIETENREQAIYAASTIDEVNAIVYPPASS
jgi:hypothetical protein